MKQFMVSVIRDLDGDCAYVPVDAENEMAAERLALEIVRKNPYQWFDDFDQPKYLIDPSSETEELDGLEYRSASL